MQTYKCVHYAVHGYNIQPFTEIGTAVWLISCLFFASFITCCKISGKSRLENHSLMQNTRHNSLKITRLFMVLSSFSPLFVLWAVKGCSLFPDYYLVLFCGLMVIGPTGFLYHRVLIAKRDKIKKTLSVGITENNKDHLLVYLFAMLLPLYSIDLNTWREFSAALIAFVFIVFLFWHLNLHYMNIVFACFGYRVFTIHPDKEDTNKYSGKESYVILSKNLTLNKGDTLKTFRLSDSVYLHYDEN